MCQTLAHCMICHCIAADATEPALLLMSASIVVHFQCRSNSCPRLWWHDLCWQASAICQSAEQAQQVSDDQPKHQHYAALMQHYAPLMHYCAALDTSLLLYKLMAVLLMSQALQPLLVASPPARCFPSCLKLPCLL